MVKRINTLEDLARISGTAAAELGLKRQLENNETITPKQKIVNEEKLLPNYVSEKSNNDNSLDVPKTQRVNLDAFRNSWNPISQHERNMTREQLQKEIDEAPKIIDKLKQNYENGLKRGEDNFGYLIAVVTVERNVDRKKRRLLELDSEINQN